MTIPNSMGWKSSDSTRGEQCLEIDVYDDNLTRAFIDIQWYINEAKTSHLWYLTLWIISSNLDYIDSENDTPSIEVEYKKSIEGGHLFLALKDANDFFQRRNVVGTSLLDSTFYTGKIMPFMISAHKYPQIVPGDDWDYLKEFLRADKLSQRSLRPDSQTGWELD